MIFQNKRILIQLKAIKEKFFDIEIVDKINNKIELYEILKIPIKINLKDIIDKEKIIEIINAQQYQRVQSLYPQNNFYCSTYDKNVILVNLLFGDIFVHCNCKGNHLIKKIIKINMDEKQFNLYFKEHDIFFDYSSVYDFEIHYDDYFTESEYIVDKNKYKFIIYGKSDINREVIIYNYLCIDSFKNKIYIFYGNSGMGKSLMLIATLKYKYDHNKVGTLYIHCKLLYNLIKKDYEYAKKILKDEAVYLFKNEYKDYINCCNSIENYLINNNTTFWDLVKLIIKCLTFKEKDYLLAFDQYNEEIFDPNNKELKALHSYNGKNLGVIAVCSLDDEGIHNYKVKNFINPYLIEKDFVTKEIENSLTMKNLSIDNGNIYDQTLIKIGKTLKNYNILKYIYENQHEEDLDNYVDKQRENILTYLLEYYKLDEKIDFNFLRYWTNTYYSIDIDLKNIKDCITFKYFDIRKNPDENKRQFEIVYLYPIVEEIMVELFSKMFYNNIRFNDIEKILNIDGGAKGYVFEKYVIHKMKPKEEDKNSLVFGYFKIDGIVKCDKFVPKKNENIDKLKKSNQTFKIGKTYLFEQRIFGGKAFDVAIIQFKDDENIFAYLYQISINKPFKDIFNEDELKDNIVIFMKYFLQIFGICFDGVYFTYIFDYGNKDEMENNCIIKGMPYIFFDSKTDAFKDSDKNEIQNINFDKYFYSPKRFGKGKNIILGVMNSEQEKSIIEFIKKEPFFGIKQGQKVFFDVCREAILAVMNNNEQKSRFFLIKMNRKEAADYYYQIYKYNKSFPKKNKKILNSDSLLLFYIDDEKNIICHIILSNGDMYPLKSCPVYSLIKNYYCYEIFTY